MKSLSSSLNQNNSGFTLVELLIVVAIIGILSTIGIPSFKRMVQKTKKSEAKVALGGIYTAQSAFYSEYGAFGNNLVKIGAELDGSPNSRIYLIGFPQADCTDVGTIHPEVTNAFGQAINASFPSYFDAGSFESVYAKSGALDNCLPGDVTAQGDAFLATATGAIAPGVLNDAALAEKDQWTMNEERLLVNLVDGVQ